VPLKNPPSNGLGCVDRSSVPHAIASVREATRENEPGGLELTRNNCARTLRRY
jgi:hypothetical protein